MSMPSGVDITDECITAFRNLLFSRRPNKSTFVIYKISDDKKSVVVDETSAETDYEVFVEKLTSARDSAGRRAPRYAVYDVKYDLKDDGQRATAVFISWVPDETSAQNRMLYAATKEHFRRAIDVKVSIHADDVSDIEWKSVLKEASGGRIQG
ncbi:cofilin, actophorin [Aspergillus keveii]|uniref:Cofilin n=1 Tax=Aspergillus keveii TaxID=714993 RepID=A0ABR4FVJ4_9EURO